MKAVTFQGFRSVEVREIPDARIEKEEDAVVRISRSSICGSDLHLFHGLIPSLEKGYVIGHEAVGIVEDVGRGVHKLKKGDRVVVPFNVACGTCYFCQHELESQCDRANEHGEAGAYFGCSRLFGDFYGTQAEAVRVPYANFTSFVIPAECELPDDVLVFLSDALPTAFWGINHAGVKPGDTVIVLGSGPIGLLVQRLAWLKGANRVITVDYVSHRLEHARKYNQAEAFDLSKVEDLGKHLKEITKGGADVVIDCVGMGGKMSFLEKVETALRLQGGTMAAVEMASQVVRKGGTIQLVGVYGTRYNGFPLGDLFARNIQLKMGQAPVIHLIPPMYRMLQEGKLTVTDLISHTYSLSDAPQAYTTFEQKEDNCLKIMLQP
ncbi:alcohol dehydrogenase catalytic domain-containing protein [Brevibacillus migulae]|uniref:alcohol dehydrogenase catalytic domain-containing protein n=1 Tax=Brevibacillus migulae TaxID=1644114 RepID=UPI00106EB36B|nr:alcohol dehydrogenase catalytic domain-containing protein [Brevibacillus migulae]